MISKTVGYDYKNFSIDDPTIKQIDKFIERIPVNKFTTYPTFNIKSVGLPNPDQIICANSELLK